MKPEEKAIELVRKYVNEIYPESLFDSRVSEHNVNLAKQCALICVEKVWLSELSKLEELSNYLPCEVYTQQAIIIDTKYRAEIQAIKNI